jgi:hypothetical protein
MLNRLIFNRIGAVIIGLIVLGVGFYMFSVKSVMCGDDAMNPGDICVTTSRSGTSVERDYDEQKADNALTSYIAMGAGGVILIGGIIANVRYYTKKKDEPTPAAADGTPAAAA